MVSITDNGTGMMPERANAPYNTTKPDGQGTSLGLSIVFGFAKQCVRDPQRYGEMGRGTAAERYWPRTGVPAATITVTAQVPKGGGP